MLLRIFFSILTYFPSRLLVPAGDLPPGYVTCRRFMALLIALTAIVAVDGIGTVLRRIRRQLLLLFAQLDLSGNGLHQASGSQRKMMLQVLVMMVFLLLLMILMDQTQAWLLHRLTGMVVVVVDQLLLLLMMRIALWIQAKASPIFLRGLSSNFSKFKLGVAKRQSQTTPMCVHLVFGFFFFYFGNRSDTASFGIISIFISIYFLFT